MVFGVENLPKRPKNKAKLVKHPTYLKLMEQRMALIGHLPLIHKLQDEKLINTFIFFYIFIL